MAKTRSQGPAADTDQVQLGGGGVARGRGGDKETDLARGRTRAGTLFTRQARGHFDTLSSLRKAHFKLFSLEPTFCMVERPISGRAGGLSEAVLRVSVNSTNISKTLLRAAVILFRLYPNSTIYCQVTANVVLTPDVQASSYSIYYGQRFSRDSKRINFGQEFDEAGEEVSKAETFVLNSPGDAARLPTNFSAEHFGNLFGRNFGNSSVRIHSVVNLVYKFAKGLEDFEEEKTTGQRWVDLF